MIIFEIMLILSGVFIVSSLVIKLHYNKNLRKLEGNMQISENNRISILASQCAREFEEYKKMHGDENVGK
mgnify:CR=1 FL=1